MISRDIACIHHGHVQGIANIKLHISPRSLSQSPELSITQSQFTFLDPSTDSQQYQNDRNDDTPCGNVDSIQVVGCLGRRHDSRNLQQ